MREMRKQDRQMAEAAAKKLLENGEYGILSSVDKDYQPYGVPLNYVLIGNTIYFHCAPQGHKLDNVAGNPQVCFTVVGDTKILPGKFTTAYRSAIAFGKAGIVTGDDEKILALTGLTQKYSAEYREQGDAYIAAKKDRTTVVKIDIEHMTGKERKE